MRCLVDADEGDGFKVQQKVIKARKIHKCCECGNTILPGNQFEHYTGSQDGSLFHYKTCLVCVEIRNRFCCGWEFTSVLEDIQYALYEEEDLNLGCVDGLSKAALDLILPMIESAWKEEENDNE